MSKFDDWYNGFMLKQKNTSLIAYGSKKLLAISAWDASREAVIDEIEPAIAILRNRLNFAVDDNMIAQVRAILEKLREVSK